MESDSDFCRRMLAEELKRHKKEQKILFSSALTGGVGVGLFLLRFFVIPYLGENELAQNVIVFFAFALMGYTGIIVLTFMFARRWLMQVQFLLTWVALPVLFIKIMEMLE